MTNERAKSFERMAQIASRVSRDVAFDICVPTQTARAMGYDVTEPGAYVIRHDGSIARVVDVPDAPE